MAEQIPLKYYEHSGGGIGPENLNMVSASPGYNTPYGATEISYDDYIAKAKMLHPNKTGTLYDDLVARNDPSLQRGVSSGYVVGANGEMTTQKAIDEQAGFKAQAAAGTMKEIEPGKFVPTGSAGDPASAQHNKPVGALPAGSAPAQGALTMPANMSVVDLLSQAGVDSSYAARQELAKQFGIQSYQGTAAQNTELGKKYLDAYNAKKGTAAPQGAGDARMEISTALGTDDQAAQGNPTQQFFDAFGSMNPVENQLFTQLSSLLSTPVNSQSLVDFYKQEVAAQGIPELNMELADIKRIIDGTEDDIREEVTRAGGFATESQVQALTVARNKGLIKKANYLADVLNAKNEYIDRIVDLTQADRKEVSEQFDRKIGLRKTLFDMSQQMNNAARENYQALVKNIGYDGLVGSIKTPQELQAVAKSLGMTSQSLLQLSKLKTTDQRAAELQEMNYKLSVDKFNEDTRQFGLNYALEKQKFAAQQAAAKASASSLYSGERARRSVDSVNTIRPLISSDTTGTKQALFGWKPGTPQYDFKAKVDALKASVSAGELTEMREASKTGGALGNTSDRDLKVLQDALGSLDVWQSPTGFADSLTTVEETLYHWNAIKYMTTAGLDYEEAKKYYTDKEIYEEFVK